MKIPDNIQWVVEMPTGILKWRPDRMKNPVVGTRKGLLQVEGYGITDGRFYCIVATCECSGYTAVRFMRRSDWFGRLHQICQICRRNKPKPKVPKPRYSHNGWGIVDGHSDD